ncbi:flagellar hook-length control protein FliK [Variovorax dokdonensis]|uniref:Flagellar hook-length control protein FliK n=1 Tax=Variovorax dokdonensis TaxID=344883 RepID=A0ABT7N4V4_9BURK|nr:flagellar hook-length control protein FliK [Variovorax dokdonensis]MDM0042973.1 flagellar hook-length control protein FliK [Variovorax dokdonensis]
MIGLSTLIDSLLAANAGRRVDVAAIKPEAEIGATGEVPLVQRAENEVRLPSRAAMERLLPSTVADAPHPSGKDGAGAPESSVEFEWSAAARIIRSVLAQERGDAGPVRGTTALWTASAAASSLAGSLAGAVEHSGLFYEAHLAQFAVGARTLAQMQAEPQARWLGAKMADASAAQAAPQPADIPSAGSLQAGVMAAVPLPAAAEHPAPHSPGSAGQSEQDHASSSPDADPAAGAPATSPAALTQEASRMQAAYRWTAAHAAAEGGAPSTLELDDSGAAAIDRSTRVSGDGLQPPQAVTLVHQQLDLLATSVFRWNGFAWPGVPMAWSIQAPSQEREHEDAASAHEQAPVAERVWLTTLSMQLPHMGTVDVRLGVAGDAVQANLTAEQDASVRLAASSGESLAGRMEAAGLRLREFQVRAAEAQTPEQAA